MRRQEAVLVRRRDATSVLKGDMPVVGVALEEGRTVRCGRNFAAVLQGEHGNGHIGCRKGVDPLPLVLVS